MAVLIEGFTIVVRIEAIDACPAGWDGFWRKVPDETARNDGYLAAVSFATRPEFRDVLERIGRLGFADAATLLEATERTPGRVMTAEQIAERLALMATTRDLALVYRLQTVRPEWVEPGLGRIPGTEVVVAGAALAGAPPVGLALPAGWTVEQAVPERYEPEPGDELLPTWHELLAESSADTRAEMLRWGPDGYLAFGSSLGQPKLFGGRIHPGGLVIEEERVERDPDGTERVVLHRWTKFPK